MINKIQLFYTKHITHDAVLDVFEAEFLKRNYIVEKIYYNELNKLDINNEQCAIINLINTAEFLNYIKTRKCIHVYGIHSSSLMKEFVSQSYSIFDAALFPTIKWYETFKKVISDTTHIGITNGFTKLDWCYNKLNTKNKVYIYDKYKLDKTKPLITYAPTYGMDPWHHFNGSEYLRDDIIHEIKKLNTNLICLEHSARQYDQHHNMFLNIADKSDILSITDILISDISGIISEFLVFDKPIIRIRKSAEYTKPREFNLWQLENRPIVDIGHIINVNEIYETCDKIINNNFIDEFSERRKYWLYNYIGNPDGNCVKRVIEQIEKSFISIESKKYWNLYYEKESSIKNETPFAQFCLSKYKIEEKKIIDLGCGCGRDSIFFSKNNNSVTGIDLSNVTINKLNSKQIQNAAFVCSDISNFVKSYSDKVDIVYSRFSLHSLTQYDLHDIFKDVFNILNTNGLFMIECRSEFDEKFKDGIPYIGGYLTSHYRRFLNIEELITLAFNAGFKLKFASVDKDHAKTENENPIVNRLILIKL